MIFHAQKKISILTLVREKRKSMKVEIAVIARSVLKTASNIALYVSMFLLLKQ